ncbi:WD40/YVTN repeat-like-containing domain-containing protein [Artemisia annua]|uniref:WD40/YVTN repeat-like-containing domain-containing protein n=1 Tax=Artemisia annua TaxID=35608 RepID=A0A2U1LSR0_ARTAN|nr:WD40/YVTN repeat-like-containing domain-containing protein [Artemisia annua]
MNPYCLGLHCNITLAHLKDQPAQSTSNAPALQPSSSYSVASSGVRYVTSKILGSSGNGSRMLGFVGGNGNGHKANGGTSKSSHVGGLSNGSSSTVGSNTSDGKGSYLIFNVGDTLYISDLTSEEKDPVKSITFGNSNPVCHAFDSKAKDGHDFLIGLNSGDVYSVSLRLQLQDVGKKLVGAHHYNKDGALNSSRCTSVAWIPERDGAFVAAHADGNLYVYEKASLNLIINASLCHCTLLLGSKDGPGDSTFPVIKDQTQFSVAHARSSKSNPIARWHICQGPINAIAFSADGRHLATVGRDGYLRVFDFLNEQLICGGKSYYGALLCCAWSPDGKYILTGGEDDLVQVWSMEDRKVVAWGEGHNSWVSGVAFDSYWSPPTSEDESENAVYRFGSVGQDTQLLLWDLAMDELVVPLRRPPGGSPTYSRTQSSHWDSAIPVGTLQPAPSTKDVPKLAPLVAHRVHSEPLSGLIFSQEAILTASRDGHVKIWTRPGSDSQVSSTDTSTPSKPVSSGFK